MGRKRLATSNLNEIRDQQFHMARTPPRLYTLVLLALLARPDPLRLDSPAVRATPIPFRTPQIRTPDTLVRRARHGRPQASTRVLYDNVTAEAWEPRFTRRRAARCLRPELPLPCRGMMLAPS